jgi:streptogramin lyase
VNFPGNSAQVLLGGGLNFPGPPVLDPAGNIFIADQSNGLVKRIPRNCSSSACVTTLGGGWVLPSGLALDGAGNVYVADPGRNAISEIPAGCLSASCVLSLGSGFNSPYGVAVDGAGNIYVADSANSAVKEVSAGCRSSSCITVLGGGFGFPTDVKVDPAGNVYVADLLNNAVKAMPAGCASASCVPTLGGTNIQPFSLAVDLNGNVYFVANNDTDPVKRIPAGCLSSDCVVALSNTISPPAGVGFDGAGNLYVSQNVASGQIQELMLATPPSLNFPTSTPLGHPDTTDGTLSIALANTGNLPLTLPASGSSANPQLNVNFLFDSGSATTCPTLSKTSSSTTLAAGATCTYGVRFRPINGNVVSGSLSVKDNHLNASAPNYTSQAISLSGISLVSPLVVSPASGTYTTPILVNLSDATYGSSIFYSVANGPLIPYTGPMLISSSSAAQIVVKVNGVVVQTEAVSYSIPSAVNPPIFSRPSGSYTNPLSVIMRSTTPGTSICYSVDSGGFSVYSQPLTISSSHTMTAVAMNSAGIFSAITTGNYSFATNVNPPVATQRSTDNGFLLIYLTPGTPGEQMFYTVNGGSPQLYTTPFLLTSTTVVTLSAYLPSTQTQSAIVTETFYVGQQPS